jgi:hypothetical protein
MQHFQCMLVRRVSRSFVLYLCYLTEARPAALAEESKPFGF